MPNHNPLEQIWDKEFEEWVLYTTPSQLAGGSSTGSKINVKLRLVRSSPSMAAPSARADAPEPTRDSAHAIQSAIEAAIANSALVPTITATAPQTSSSEVAQTSVGMPNSPVVPPPPILESPPLRREKEYLVVPHYCVNMSMDIKFEADPDQVRARSNAYQE